MLSYFNPNAARKTLYPSLVKHVLMNEGMLLWKPREREIDNIFGAGLFLDLCNSPDYGPQIGFCVDELTLFDLHKKDTVWNKAIREKITYVRRDELNELIRTESTKYYRELKRQDGELEDLLRDLQQDLVNNDYDILQSIAGRPEWEGNGACALFVSIAQELEMHRASGASQLLCRPQRWEVTQAVARHMAEIWSRLPLGPHMAEISGRPYVGDPPALPSPDDPEAIFELIRDLMAARYVQANHATSEGSLRAFREFAAEAESDLATARLFLDSFRRSGIRVPKDLYKLVAKHHENELRSGKDIWALVTGALRIGWGAVSQSPPFVVGAMVLLALQTFWADPGARKATRLRSRADEPSLLLFQNPDWWLDQANYD